MINCLFIFKNNAVKIFTSCFPVPLQIAVKLAGKKKSTPENRRGFIVNLYFYTDDV